MMATDESKLEEMQLLNKMKTLVVSDSKLRHDLLAALTQLRIRQNDSAEIEYMFRTFVFPDLPEREDRAKDLANLIGTTVSEALYIVYYLNKSLQNDGDICEFGVAQGATSALLAGEIKRDPTRNLWLFDSFEGLPKPHEKDVLLHDIFGLGAMDRYEGQMKCREEEVRERLAVQEFPEGRTRVMRGWVEDVLRGGLLPDKVAFAYVDFDFYNPIKETLDFVDDRMPVGSSIIVDDYGFFSQGAAVAVHEFLAATAGRYRFAEPLPGAGKFCILTKLR